MKFAKRVLDYFDYENVVVIDEPIPIGILLRCSCQIPISSGICNICNGAALQIYLLKGDFIAPWDLIGLKKYPKDPYNPIHGFTRLKYMPIIIGAFVGYKQYIDPISSIYQTCFDSKDNWTISKRIAESGLLNMLSGKSGLFRGDVITNRNAFSLRSVLGIVTARGVLPDEHDFDVLLPRKGVEIALRPYFIGRAIREGKTFEFDSEEFKHYSDELLDKFGLDGILLRNPTLNERGLPYVKAGITDTTILKCQLYLMEIFAGDADGDNVSYQIVMDKNVRKSFKYFRLDYTPFRNEPKKIFISKTGLLQVGEEDDLNELLALPEHKCPQIGIEDV